MFKYLSLFPILIYSINTYSFNNEAEVKKTYLEDILIWKISNELKLTAQEERKFTEINKSLNKQKADINRKIQESVQSMSENNPQSLEKHKKLIQAYNQISVSEFDSIKKLLGAKKFINYLKLKSELTTKVKAILIGEKNNEKEDKKSKSLPPPKVIVETK